MGILSLGALGATVAALGVEILYRILGSVGSFSRNGGHLGALLYGATLVGSFFNLLDCFCGS
jgi:hypothetical protein